MSRSIDNPWLHRFAVLTAICTLGLIGVGGLVTSKGVGMSVPDWPTTYGYNMFLFPVSQWVGGVFYEHTHRLAASFVGLLTTILMVWLWLREERRWLRWLGVAAFLAVVLQGVIGGLRVRWMIDSLGIPHAALAQAFLVLITALALFTSRWWTAVAERRKAVGAGPLRPLLAGVTVLIFVQLVVGASMRHQHAGLAVPDFPLAYGKVWPPTDAAFVDRVNRQRMEVEQRNPITAGQIHLHMMHRVTAFAILLAAAFCAWKSRRIFGAKDLISRMSLIWFGLVFLQGLLGAATVWSNKAADVATLHVVLGAAILNLGAILALVTHRMSLPRNAEKSVTLGGGPAPVMRRPAGTQTA